ncbi:elements of external origin [Emcibacter sp. SYSU 3D8]
MSEREYAARVGLSRGAVQKAKTSGRLVLHPDGSIDPDKSDARRQASTDPSKQRQKMKPVPEAALSSVGETLRENGLGTLASGGTTFLQARTANEVLKAQERRLRLQKLKGDLIDRSRVTALVFRLARDERDGWINWPARAAALMAAELGVDVAAMQTVLEKHVRLHLSELADVRPEFR